MLFRGVYLTSGLQTGTPIAKALAGMAGVSGEADTRKLESLFTRQRAYFIHDLITKRVFRESGLVRPTRQRVLATRRKKLAAYGFASLIAVAAIVSSAVYAFGRGSPDELTVYRRALDSAERLSADPSASLPDTLAALDDVQRAVDGPRSGYERYHTSTKGDFERLYATIFDRRLLPRLRSEAERQLSAPPASYADFQKQVADLEFLLGPVDLSRADDRRTLLEALPPNVRATGSELAMERPLAKRAEYADAVAIEPWKPAGDTWSDDPELVAAVERLSDDYGGVLTPGRPVQYDRSELGYLLSWWGLQDFEKRLEDYDPARREREDVDEIATGYWRCYRILDGSGTDFSKGGAAPQDLATRAYDKQLEELSKLRAHFLQLVGRTDAAATWEEREGLKRWVGDVFRQARNDPATGPVLSLKEGGPRIYQDKLLYGVCDPSLVPADWTPADLLRDLERGLKDFLDKGAGSSAAGRVFEGKCLRAGEQYRERFPSWRELAAALHGVAPTSNDYDRDLVLHLSQLREDLVAIDRRLLDDWIGHVDELLLGHLGDAGPSLGARRAAPGAVPAVDTDFVGPLGRLRDSVQKTADRASSSALLGRVVQARRRHLAEVEAAALDYLRRGAGNALEDLRALHGIRSGIRASYEPEELSADTAHQQWQADVDALIEKRLADHEQALQRYFEPPPSPWPDLDAAAQDVRRLAAIDILQHLADRAPAPGARELASQLGSMDASDALPETKARIDSMQRFGVDTLTQDWQGVRDAADKLRELAQRFQGPAALKEGPAMAKALLDYRSARKPPPASGPAWYLGKLDASFGERVLDEIRAAYRSDYMQRIVNQGSNRAALESLRADAPRAVEDSVVASTFDALFRAGGALDQLDRTYSCGAGGLVLPPAVLTGRADAPFWAFEKFLRDLRAFLRGDGGEPITGAEVSITLTPFDDGLKDTIWSEQNVPGNRNYWYCATLRADWKEQLETYGRGKRTLAWTFTRGLDKGLWLRFSDVASSDQKPRDAICSVPGFLAPLKYAWTWGQVDGDGGTSWKVRPQPSTQGAEEVLPAPLLFEFAKSVPKLPPIPE